MRQDPIENVVKPTAIDNLRSHRWRIYDNNPLSRQVWLYASDIRFDTISKTIDLSFYGLPEIHRAIKHDSVFPQLRLEMTNEQGQVEITYLFYNVSVTNFSLDLSYRDTDIVSYDYKLKYDTFKEL